jgi:hypothetical protein
MEQPTLNLDTHDTTMRRRGSPGGSNRAMAAIDICSLFAVALVSVLGTLVQLTVCRREKTSHMALNSDLAHTRSRCYSPFFRLRKVADRRNERESELEYSRYLFCGCDAQLVRTINIVLCIILRRYSLNRRLLPNVRYSLITEMKLRNKQPTRSSPTLAETRAKDQEKRFRSLYNAN